MPVTFASGTGGRVLSSSVVVANISEWKLSKQVAAVPTNTFENAADAHSIVWEKFLIGLANATADLNGLFDVGTNSETVFYIGMAVSLDLYLDRTPLGPRSLVGFVKSVSYGTNVNNQAASFSMQVQLSGLVAAAT